MIRRLVELAVMAVGLALPAFAQGAGEACILKHREFHAAAVELLQRHVDVAVALTARADLAPKEAAAREACEPLGYRFVLPIELTKEDLDIALAQRVPPCSIFMQQAAPHIAMLPKLKLVPRQANDAIADLKRIRGEAAEPCKDYPGVTSRMLRVENDLVFSMPAMSGDKGG